MHQTAVYALAAIIVLTLLVAYAYKKGWLNKYIPKGWVNKKSHFVGVYGRTPALQNCLMTAEDGSVFNRCMWA
jgi:hypothetical protein